MRAKVIESVTGQELESGLLISRLVHISGLLESVPASRVGRIPPCIIASIPISASSRPRDSPSPASSPICLWGIPQHRATDTSTGQERQVPFFFVFVFVFLLLRAAPTACGSSQARGQIGAAAATVTATWDLSRV